MLMGGGADIDEPFRWFTENMQGGDLIVLRASDKDEYNGVFAKFNNLNSIETFVFKDRQASFDPYLLKKIKNAEGVFISGGDQFKYLTFWKGTPLAQLLTERIKSESLVLGGTSAGLAVMGGYVYSAAEGTIYSDEALNDPFNFRNLISNGIFDVPFFKFLITDSHFANRDRMGRLVSWMARLFAPQKRISGLGVDESTFVLIDEFGVGYVEGLGAVYFLTSDKGPQICQPGQALEFSAVKVSRLKKGDKIEFSSSQTYGGVNYLLNATGGQIDSSQLGGAVY